MLDQCVHPSQLYEFEDCDRMQQRRDLEERTLGVEEVAVALYDITMG